MDAETSVNRRLQLVEQAIEELRKGQSDMQQSMVDLTSLITRIHVQLLEEAIQPPRNQIQQIKNGKKYQETKRLNQEHPRNQAVHIHNNRLYGNNLPGYMLDDSDSFDEDNLLNIHQDLQRGLGFRPQFQEDQEIRMKVDLPTFNGRMDVEKFLDWIKNVDFFLLRQYPKTQESLVGGIQAPRWR
ncbi:hypothetical protein IC582_011164 [Cucumis melo]